LREFALSLRLDEIHQSVTWENRGSCVIARSETTKQSQFLKKEFASLRSQCQFFGHDVTLTDKQNAVLTGEGIFVMMPAVPINNPINPTPVSRVPGRRQGLLDSPVWLTAKCVRGLDVFLLPGQRDGFS
jgi:hypothetical protein